MPEPNRIRTLVATLRDAVQEIESELGLTREGVDAIRQEAVRLREGLAALSALRWREDASVGIDMAIDATVALLQAFHDLELALPDAQGTWRRSRRRWRTTKTAATSEQGWRCEA